jgi:hypothetical protein
VSDFLSKMDGGRTLQTFRKNQNVFAQGDTADAADAGLRAARAQEKSKRRRVTKTSPAASMANWRC